MAVHVEVAVVEAVAFCARRRHHGHGARRLVDWALLVGRHRLAYPFEARDVGRRACLGVEYGPHRARVAYYFTIEQNLEIALGEEPVERAYPCADGIGGVYARIEAHLDGHTRENPRLVGLDQRGVAYAQLVGVERGNLNQAVDQQRDGHSAFGVALRRRQKVCLLEYGCHRQRRGWLGVCATVYQIISLVSLSGACGSASPASEGAGVPGAAVSGAGLGCSAVAAVLRISDTARGSRL